MVYKRQKIIFIIYNMIIFQILGALIFFGIFSIILKNILPITLGFGLSIMSVFACFIGFSIRGITNKIIINENEILIKKDSNIIFIKNNFDLINIKMNGLYKGIVLKNGNIECLIMKYEFNKNEWERIYKIITEYSKNIIKGSDYSELKYIKKR